MAYFELTRLIALNQLLYFFSKFYDGNLSRVFLNRIENRESSAEGGNGSSVVKRFRSPGANLYKPWSFGGQKYHITNARV
jgi:hypothetical protein